MILPTLRQLQYLKLLAEHGSFGKAAEAAHVTQPTLSAGVQELEKILGGPVVDRARSGVILTALGEAALAKAVTILNEAEDLVQSARNAGQPLTGRFRLGVIPTVAPFLLPLALPLLRSRFPKLRLFLREDLTHRLIALLKAGQLDAAQRRPLADALTVRRGEAKGQAQAKLSDATRENLLRIGRERALIYKTLVLTGLRKGELASITLGQVDLGGSVPYLLLHARDEKNRRGSEIPLRADLAADIRSWLADRLTRAQQAARDADVAVRAAQ